MYNFLIVKPFSWLLLTLYNFVGNFGLALIIFSLIVKVILLPFGIMSKKSMMKTSRLSPKMKALEKKYADDKVKYQAEVSKLYQEEKINPLSGCLWSLAPLVVTLGLYSVVRQPLTNLMGLTADQIALISDTLTGLGVDVASGNAAYSQITIAGYFNQFFDQIKAIVPNVINIDFSFFGLDLSQIPSITDVFQSGFFQQDGAAIWAGLGLVLIPIISGGLNFLTSWLSQKMNNSVATDDKGQVVEDTSSTQSSMKTMLYMMPLVSVYIGFVMPAAISIYWIAQSLFSIIQDVVLTKYYRKKYDDEDLIKAQIAAEREAIEIEKEARRQEKRELMGENRNPNTSKRKLKNQQKAIDVPAPEGKLTEEEREEYRQKKEQAELRAAGKLDADRPYARGRAYSSERYDSPAQDDITDIADLSDEVEADEVDEVIDYEEPDDE